MHWKYTNTMYHEFTHCCLVTLTVTMLVSVLPPVLPSASVALNSTSDYLLNSTTSSPLVSSTSISEPRTSNVSNENLTLAVLLSQSSTAVTSSTMSTETSLSSQSSSVTSSYNILSSSSTPSVNRTVTISHNANTLTLSEATQNSSLLPTGEVTSKLTDSLDTLAMESPQGQSRLEVVLVKKLLQKWGYMPIKKNGCWIYRDWRKEAVDPLPVSCSSSQSNSETTTVSSVPVTYESISEFATSDFSGSKEVTPEDDSNLSQEEREKFHNGMMVYQEFFKLPVTGRLDLPTARVIRQRVCGVPDSPERIQINKTLLQDEHRTNSSVPEDSVQTSTVLSTILRGRHVTSRPTPSDYVTVTDMVSATMEVDYALTEIVTETSSDVSSNTGHGEANPTTSSEGKGTISMLSNNRPTSSDTSRLKRRSLADYFPGLSAHRVKRSTNSQSNSNQCSQYFNGLNRPIRWRIEKKEPSDDDNDAKTDSSDFQSNTLLRSVISAAFRRWAEVSTLTFEEKHSGYASHVDIMLRFISDGYTGTPAGCNVDSGCFSASEMAMTTNLTNYQTRIYFRDTSQHPWSYQSSSSSTRDLLTVAVHEIGHALCLGHNSDSNSVMYPSYVHPQYPYRVRIDGTSRQNMKSMYGSCTGRFVAFDWVRTVNGVKKYSTFLFRQNRYWLWENGNTRTRYADPRRLNDTSSEWKNAYRMETNLQAIVHTTPKQTNTNQFKTFFLAGGRSLKYNYASDTVISNLTISTAFGAKTGGSQAIPLDVKAAYYDKTDENIYFFDSTHVYAYDTSLGQNGCCVDNYPKPIGEAYPGYATGVASLEAGIDGAYYSIADRKLYFFKGNCYWETTYDPSDNNSGGSNVKVKAKIVTSITNGRTFVMSDRCDYFCLLRLLFY
ncbi:uncharacterized protein [Amphiura filiformis]|uniref:uncharacterized protein n=1 Tax=Amphiura filiformis TaxID=82378 RepID=UPI003B20DAF6